MNRRGFLASYPGNVDEPLKLAVPPDAIEQLGEYGDIVTFPLKDGEFQRDTMGFCIHPGQQFILVRSDENSD